jgi:hypothetical protein
LNNEKRKSESISAMESLNRKITKNLKEQKGIQSPFAESGALINKNIKSLFINDEFNSDQSVTSREKKSILSSSATI